MTESVPGPDRHDSERAEQYEDWFSTPFGRRADRVEHAILRHLLSQVPEARSLLDIGCGTGHFADLWSSYGLSAVGIDSDLAALKYAQAHHPRFPLTLGDATFLPVRDSSVDIVAMVTVLEFAGDPARALREASRVARKAVLLGALNAASPVACWRRLRGSHAYAGATFCTRGSLARLVRQSVGDRRFEMRLETGLYPLPWLEQTRGPLGAFVGLIVRFR